MEMHIQKNNISFNWVNLVKPSNYKSKKLNNCTTLFLIEPLERGFGITLGNSIRRILLSSLQGSAICAVKIPGIRHEYSNLNFIQEDTTQVILNLKSVTVKGHTAFDKKNFFLYSNKKGTLKSCMIRTPPEFNILNPDLIICNLIKKVSLVLYLIIISGKGYKTAREHDLILDSSYIKIDSIFSPISNCFFEVYNSRIGSKIEYDKLLFTIKTNGALEPNLAIALAAKIFQEQLQIFINFKYVYNIHKPKKEKIPFNKNLLRKIADLELSVRSHNCLKNDNINYIGDLVVKTESQMLKTSNFGKKSLNEIKELLSHMNLSFGMTVEKWPPHNIEQVIKRFKDNYYEA